MTNSRCRSIFYTCLGRLLILDLNEDVTTFEAFMLPLTSKFLLKLFEIFINYLPSLIRRIRFDWSSNDEWHRSWRSS